MGSFLDKFKRIMDEDEHLVPPAPLPPPAATSATATIASTASTTPYITSASGMTGTVVSNPWMLTGIQFKTQHIIHLSNYGKDIVTLKADGSVVWADGYNVDEAADAFAKMLSLSAELSAGITKKVKLEMRNSVFNDIISIAKEKGSLTAEDLTYLLEASKIVEKLKGGKNDS